MGVELIDNTLQIITSMQAKRRELEEEIARLKVSMPERMAANQDYEKSKFMEGAVWLGKRMTNEVEKLCQFVDSVARDHAERAAEERHRADQWLVEAVKRASMVLYESAITILESAILNMEEAAGNLTQQTTVKKAVPRFSSASRGSTQLSAEQSDEGLKGTARFVN